MRRVVVLAVVETTIWFSCVLARYRNEWCLFWGGRILTAGSDCFASIFKFFPSIVLTVGFTQCCWPPHARQHDIDSKAWPTAGTIRMGYSIRLEWDSLYHFLFLRVNLESKRTNQSRDTKGIWREKPQSDILKTTNSNKSKCECGCRHLPSSRIFLYHGQIENEESFDNYNTHFIKRIPSIFSQQDETRLLHLSTIVVFFLLGDLHSIKTLCERKE